MYRLTKRTVEKLGPGDSEYFVWDDALAGFGVRVFPSGRKSYLVQYRAGGRSRRRSVGQHGALTAEEARKEARILLGEVAKGGNPAEERQRALRAPTIASLCERFLDEYTALHCKPSTQKSYRSYLETWVIPKLGRVKIDEITRADVVAFHHDMRSKPYTANRAVAMLSKMFNLAED